MATNAKNTGKSKLHEIVSATGANLLSSRADRVVAAVSDCFESVVFNLKKRQRAIQNEIEDLQDLSVKSSHSLQPVNENFNAESWVGRLLELKRELYDVAEALEIAEATQAEFVGTSQE